MRPRLVDSLTKGAIYNMAASPLDIERDSTKVGSFVTEKGSKYSFFSDGAKVGWTRRDKRNSMCSGGWFHSIPSTSTIFCSPDPDQFFLFEELWGVMVCGVEVPRISWGEDSLTLSSTRHSVLPLEGDWKEIKQVTIQFRDEPALGLAPLEFWETNSGRLAQLHLGHKIVEMG